jgi:hypothetical protein
MQDHRDPTHDDIPYLMSFQVKEDVGQSIDHPLGPGETG